MADFTAENHEESVQAPITNDLLDMKVIEEGVEARLSQLNKRTVTYKREGSLALLPKRLPLQMVRSSSIKKLQRYEVSRTSKLDL